MSAQSIVSSINYVIAIPSELETTEEKIIQLIIKSSEQYGKKHIIDGLISFRANATSMNLYLFACSRNWSKLRDYLFENKLLTDHAFQRAYKGNTDLTYGVVHNDFTYIKKRLLTGANVNTCNESDSLLSLAVSNGNVSMTELLLSFNADPNLHRPLSSLVLHESQKEMDRVDTNYCIARMLIQNGANVFRMVPLNFGPGLMLNKQLVWTPLAEAARPKLAKLLNRVIHIKMELNITIPLLLLGQNDPNSPLSSLPIEVIRKINDTARFTLVASWAEETL